MISPIKTIITNLSKTAVRFRISSRLAVAMTPAGTNGDVVKLSGDIFTLLDSDRSATYVLSMVKSGSIKIGYTVDKPFDSAVSTEINMNVPSGDICDWYVANCRTVIEAPKKAETPKKVEEVKPAAPAAEPIKTEEPKAAEPAKEPAKEEAPKKAEEVKVVEPKKEEAKGGRKIKVQ